MDISIVIVTHERPRRLLHTLRSLNRNVGATPFEVVVVDDGSGVAMTGAVEAAAPVFPYKLLWLPHSASLSMCRNHGAARAEGSVILFLDDDLVTPASVVQSHRRMHDDAGNRVVLGLRNTVPAAVWEHSSADSFEYLQQYAAPDPRPYAIDQESWRRIPWVYMAGCHFSVTKSFFQAAGRFDENYRGWGFEDIDLAYRFFRRGAEFVLLRESVPVHLDDPGIHRWPDGSAALGRDKVESYLVNGNLFASKFQDDALTASVVEWDRVQRTTGLTTFGDCLPHPALRAFLHSDSLSSDREEITIPPEMSLFTEFVVKDEQTIVRPIHQGERNDASGVSERASG